MFVFAVNVVSTLVAIIGVDRVGRRALFIWSGIFMIACEIIMGVVLGHYFAHGNSLPDNVSNGVLAVICIYVANFAWSWGAPLSPLHHDISVCTLPCLHVHTCFTRVLLMS